MSKETIEKVLNNVDNNRRGFLKTVLLGSAAVAALPVMSSVVFGQDAPADGKGKGEGKGKGKGKGKGDDAGKGEGKGY